jgi:hypothetical protein
LLISTAAHLIVLVILLVVRPIEAVRKWRYSPLFLNGNAERFVLTVTVSFRLST